MSEKEYKELVLADFDRKVREGLLAPELLSPSPGNLKAKCLDMCQQGVSPKDERILISFYEKKEDVAGYLRTIQAESPDRFRPLSSFLRDRSVNTNFKNIELLAWLTDFEPRPYRYDLELPYEVDGDRSELPIDVKETPTVITAALKGHQYLRKKLVYWLPYALVLIALVSITYFLMHSIAPPITGHKGCMFWDNDHYQPTACTESLSHRKLRPINNILVQNFHKITRPDTLTPYSIGKVWYGKYYGRIEFYTAPGPYPTDTNRRVLHMSTHILNKYVYHIEN